MNHESFLLKVLIGLMALLASLVGYMWHAREGRLGELEKRIEIREQAWHDGRLNLQKRIGDIEHAINTLQYRVNRLSSFNDGGDRQDGD